MKLMSILKEYILAKDEPQKNDMAQKVASYRIIRYFIGALSRSANDNNFIKFKRDLDSLKLKESIIFLQSNKSTNISNVEKTALEFIETVFLQLKKIDFDKKYKLKSSGNIVKGNQFAILYLNMLDDKVSPVFDTFDDGE